jgi:hypothetical protein
MIRAKNSSLRATSERQALRRRVKQMHTWFNQGHWEKCFSLIDPVLREKGRVELPIYAKQLQEFKKVYGMIHLWYVRISLFLDGSVNKRDPRPFAYVYVVWQDDAHRFHVFQERWVRDGDHWFTRVAGLIPDRRDAAANQD